jgi:cytochrome d ubiquinol oxidase subunit I
VSFHIVSPAFSIRLGGYLVLLNGMFVAPGRQIYFEAFNYSKKIFVAVFGIGIVSGTVMS